MTILIGTRRATFAVIAADQLWYGIDAEGNRTEGLIRKLVVHPTLPLAMGSAGFGNLPAGGRSTRSYLEEIVADIERPTDLTIAGVMKRLEARLHPLVRVMLASPSLPSGPHKNELAILVAIANRKRADLGRLLLAKRTTRELAPGSIDAPLSLQPFYTGGAYASSEALFGAQFLDATDVVRHLRRAVSHGIEAERELVEGHSRETGGNVNVVLVDAAGARLV